MIEKRTVYHSESIIYVSIRIKSRTMVSMEQELKLKCRVGATLVLNKLTNEKL